VVRERGNGCGSMTVAEYEEQAAVTASYAEGSVYPYLGLIEEIGEAAGIIAKAERDNGGVLDEVRREQLKAELGDVLWMIAAVARDYDLTLHQDEEPNFSAEGHPTHPSYVLFGILSETAGSLMLGFDAPSCQPERDIGVLLTVWEDLCFAYGFKPVDVAAANLEKLASRKQRGVIHGEGDNR